MYTGDLKQSQNPPSDGNPTSGGENKWPCINHEENKGLLTCHLQDQDLLPADTCPFVAARHPFPPCPSPGLVVRAGIQLTEVWPMDAEY